MVQDPMSGQLITKEPKHERLFFLQLPIPHSYSPFSFQALLCNESKVSNEVWYKRLGHPNSRILSYLLKSGLLNNKVHSSTVFSDCAIVNLTKVKFYPFHLKVVEQHRVLR